MMKRKRHLALDDSKPATTNSESCFSETVALLDNEEILEAYNNIAFTSSDDHEMEDDPSYFIMNHKYSSSNNLITYQSTCEHNGGVFRQLSFHSTCSQRKHSTNDLLRTFQMEIVNFVRCYGKSCGADEDEELFERFTLRPTERLNNKKDASYLVCDGALFNDSAAGTMISSSDKKKPTCQWETASLTKDKELLSAYENLTVKSTSLIDELEIKYKDNQNHNRKKTVDVPVHALVFAQDQSYVATCEKSGGVFTNRSFNFSCMSGDYQVTNAQRCLGSSCNDEDSEDLFDLEKSAISSLSHMYGSNSSAFYHSERCAATLDGSIFVDKEGKGITIGVIAALLGATAIAGITALFLSLYTDGSDKENPGDSSKGKTEWPPFRGTHSPEDATKRKDAKADLENGHDNVANGRDQSILVDDSLEWPADISYSCDEGSTT